MAPSLDAARRPASRIARRSTSCSSTSGSGPTAVCGLLDRRPPGALPAVIVLTAYDYPQYAEAALRPGRGRVRAQDRATPRAARRDPAGRRGRAGLRGPARAPGAHAGSRRASSTSSGSWSTAAATTRSGRRSGSARRPSRRTSPAVRTVRRRVAHRARDAGPARGLAGRAAPGLSAHGLRRPTGPHGLSVPVRLRARAATMAPCRTSPCLVRCPRPRARRAAGSPDAVLPDGRRRARHHRGGRAALDPHRVAADAPIATGSRSTSTSTRSTTRTSTRATSARSSTSTTTTSSSSCTSRSSTRTPAGS